MPDPDKSSASQTYVYVSTFALAIIIAIAIIIVYNQSRNFSTAMFSMILWGIIPVIIFMLGVGLNVLGQYIACKSVHVGPAFSSSWPILPFVYGALGISQISYIRAPITSLFVQIPQVTVIDAENRSPTLKGFAVAYYVFFGVLFGQVISSGFSQVCS
jgi:cytochrome bd-type quinol oxidase subunit 2